MIISIIIKRKGKDKNKSKLICPYISHTKRLVNVSLAFKLKKNSEFQLT